MGHRIVHRSDVSASGAYGFSSAGNAMGECPSPDCTVLSGEWRAQVLDVNLRISWSAPNDHGEAISQYAYQICSGSSCGLDPDDSSFSTLKYMCSDGSVSTSICSSGGSLPLSPQLALGSLALT